MDVARFNLNGIWVEKYRPQTLEDIILSERNKDIVNAIEKVISLGYNVCIWPESVKQKDVNDMVKSGMSVNEIQKLIDQHTYKDLLAKMMLSQWKKV